MHSNISRNSNSNRGRKRKMVSTSKRIVMAATVLLAIAVAPAQSKTRNLAIDENQEQQSQDQRIEYGTTTHPGISPVPTDVIESMNPKLIDFVIAGFPKCGTTFLQNKIFFESKKIFIPHHETHYLANDKYKEFQNEFANVTRGLVVGYKSPFELGHSKSLRNLQALFPDVRMVVTMRHPILQFQSLYNYELRKSRFDEFIPLVSKYVGNCREQCRIFSSDTGETMDSSCLENVRFCSGEASYHQYLSRLGLTPMNTTEELDLLDHHHMSIHPFPSWRKESNVQQQSFLRSGRDEASQEKKKGRVFLMEIGQLDNRANQSMTDDLVSDLEDFLGLEHGDIPLLEPQNGDTKQQYEWPPGREQYKLDICLEKYRPLRETILETSRKTTEWILEYFLHPSNDDVVVVSNREIFERMLEGWKADPCENEDEGAK